jgi:hypothetical protein
MGSPKVSKRQTHKDKVMASVASTWPVGSATDSQQKPPPALAVIAQAAIKIGVFSAL